ncbi:MAG: methyltransferase domain-containing protein [Candidatus Thorarchaeota archaeon]|nr:methyltransferase domain-containing protein [Candidatus Thorarchaeota archaeon]
MPGERVPEDYIDRLVEFWPEPREQLHFGGWSATYELVEKLNLDKTDDLLDICCGEGGTACWLAKKYRRRVSGIDALERAIVKARECAKNENVEDRTTFKVADIFDLPFQDSSFNVVYGQDPDGLAHQERVEIFRECRRVLRPNRKIGFQHWLPHANTPQEDLEYFEKVTVGTGYPYMTRLCVTDYIEDLKAGGFVNIIVDDLSEMYMNHALKIQKIFHEKDQPIDTWHGMLIELYDKGIKIGVRIIAESK